MRQTATCFNPRMSDLNDLDLWIEEQWLQPIGKEFDSLLGLQRSLEASLRAALKNVHTK